jgi:hypothetical protein
MLIFDQRSFRGTYGVKCCKRGVLCQINIGLQIFLIIKNKLFFAATFKFYIVLSRQNFDFLPRFKIISPFGKKLQLQIQIFIFLVCTIWLRLFSIFL